MLDFSTLLPGPLATLMLAEAGAEVIKIERPGQGDELRAYEPRFGDASLQFGLLNRGKRSIAIDCKAPGAVERLRPLLESADVLVEQFRPGAMARMGLSFDDVRAINPRLVYCSINGYGSSGANAGVAAHDLNYVAASGLLAHVGDERGAPVLPHALIADIGGGALPAVINILLALRVRDATGAGCAIEIAMAESVLAFTPLAYALDERTGAGPIPSGEALTGGSPRYGLYRAADGRYLAVAPLEQRFWDEFCDAIGLPAALRDDSRDPAAAMAGVAAILAAQTSAEWMRRFAGRDVCCSIVRSPGEARSDPAYVERGAFERVLAIDGATIAAAPLPLDARLRDAARAKRAPALGEANALLATLESAPLPRRGDR